MSIITKQFLQCDYCSKLFEISDVTSYKSHISKHKKYTAMNARVKLYDRQRLHDLLYGMKELALNISDTDKFVEDIKKFDIQAIKKLYLTESMQNISHDYTFYSAKNIIDAHFDIIKIFLRKSHNELYIDIFLKGSCNLSSPDTIHKDGIEVKCAEQHYRERCDLPYVSIKLGDTTNFPYLEKWFMNKFIKAKLKSSSKKFTKNKFRLDV